MIEDGVLEGVDVIFGNHVLSTIELGSFTVPKGSATSSSDYVELKIIGKGGHSASPHTAVNPINIGVQIVNQIYLLVSQRVSPVQPIAAVITMFEAGETINVIPSEAKIAGTVRTFSEDQSERIKQYLIDIVDHVTKIYGATYELEYKRGYPSLLNTEHETEIVRKVLSSIDSFNVIEVPPIMASEDFSYYLQHVPGVYFFTGSSTEDPNTRFPHHHPWFNIDERAMKNSAIAFLSIVDHYLVK